jgi:hypothetical protein
VAELVTGPAVFSNGTTTQERWDAALCRTSSQGHAKHGPGGTALEMHKPAGSTKKKTTQIQLTNIGLHQTNRTEHWVHVNQDSLPVQTKQKQSFFIP